MKILKITGYKPMWCSPGVSRWFCPVCKKAVGDWSGWDQFNFGPATKIQKWSMNLTWMFTVGLRAEYVCGGHP